MASADEASFLPRCGSDSSDKKHLVRRAVSRENLNYIFSHDDVGAPRVGDIRIMIDEVAVPGGAR